jgi:protoporphyrinogen oxidase
VPPVIVVVGAGPAGLAAAWRAALAGREVTVVERAPAVGGLAGSFEVAGVRVDHGSHRLHPSTPAPILAALRELLGDDLQTRPRNGRIRMLDRWIAFPLRTADLLRRTPRAFAARAARDAAVAPLRRARADTFAEVVRAGLGPAVLNAFYAPYARKLWDTEADQLAGELARRRVSASSPLAIARKLLGGARPEGRTFLYPRRGFGQISEALADAATEAGATIRLGTGARRLSPHADGSGWGLKLDDGSTLEADLVWSTAPLAALLPAIDPLEAANHGRPPTEVVEAAQRLRHRAMVLLYLVLDQRQWTAFDAHYFPGPAVVASRVSEPRNYRTSADDPPDRTVLCAEIPCWEGDEVWHADPDQLAERLSDELAAAGLPRPRAAAAQARRLPKAYPLYRPGFAEDLAALEGWAAAQERLVTFGRQGLFTPDNTHHALAMGWAAAETLSPDADRQDAVVWRSRRDGFREFVVED